MGELSGPFSNLQLMIGDKPVVFAQAGSVEFQTNDEEEPKSSWNDASLSFTCEVKADTLHDTIKDFILGGESGSRLSAEIHIKPKDKKYPRKAKKAFVTLKRGVMRNTKGLRMYRKIWKYNHTGGYVYHGNVHEVTPNEIIIDQIQKEALNRAIDRFSKI